MPIQFKFVYVHRTQQLIAPEKRPEIEAEFEKIAESEWLTPSKLMIALEVLSQSDLDGPFPEAVEKIMGLTENVMQKAVDNVYGWTFGPPAAAYAFALAS